MAYNPPTRKATVLYRLGGWATCLGPHRRSAPSSPRAFYGKPTARSDARPLRIRPSSGTSWSCGSTKSRTGPMRRPANAWAFRGVRAGGGAHGGPRGPLPWRTSQAGGVSPFLPPLDHALVKAVAGERVAATKQPRRRQALAAITARSGKALDKPLSRSTVWRLLETDALKAWRYTYWLFPREPYCAEKAGPMLAL